MTPLFWAHNLKRHFTKVGVYRKWHLYGTVVGSSAIIGIIYRPEFINNKKQEKTKTKKFKIQPTSVVSRACLGDEAGN